MKILSTSFSYPSASLLRDTIEKLTGKRFLITRNPNDDVILRYGNGNKSLKLDTQYNTSDLVNLLANKLRFSVLLQKNSIYTPIFSKETSVTFPCLVRTTLTGSKGKGILFCENQEEFDKVWNENFYWTEYKNLVSEYRVHMLGGCPVKIFKKVWNSDEEEPKVKIRSNQFYHFSLVEQENRFAKLKNTIDKINEVLGVENFYALDVGYDGEYFIIEGNSAPGLNELTAEIYAKFLIEKIELLRGN